MEPVGGNSGAAVSGIDELPGRSNYFIGNDPKQWRSNIATYSGVKYWGVYPGIDLVYHGNQRQLEYDFVVAPGADPQVIALRFQGADKMSVNRAGALVLQLGGVEVIEHAPVAYQEIGGQRKAVASRYELRGKGRVGFRLAAFDKGKPLVIDPTLTYSTYLGGSDDDVGQRHSRRLVRERLYHRRYRFLRFPHHRGRLPDYFRWESGDAFVSKLNADGSALLYSTYLGGSDDD